MKIKYYAAINQATGENWKTEKLSFSTVTLKTPLGKTLYDNLLVDLINTVFTEKHRYAGHLSFLRARLSFLSFKINKHALILRQFFFRKKLNFLNERHADVFQYICTKIIVILIN